MAYSYFELPWPPEIMNQVSIKAGIILNNEHNDFLLVYASKVKEFEDLNATVCVRVRFNRQAVILTMCQSMILNSSVRYHFIRDHILKDAIELHFVPTDLQLADIFTKPLAKPIFTRLVTELDLDYTKDFVSLPSNEMMKDAITTLGLVDDKKPELKSVDLAYLCLLRIKYFLLTWKIIKAIFKDYSILEVPFTSYMRKVAKLLEKPLILPSEEVNTKDIDDKTLTRTSMHPVSQSKAKTDNKLRKKKIPSSSRPKVSKTFRGLTSNTQPSESQPAEETEVPSNTTPNIKEEDNQSQHKELSKSKEMDADNVLDELADMKDFIDKTSLLEPLSHLYDELSNLTTKVQNLASSISKQITEKLEKPSMIFVAERIKENLLNLISKCLKNSIP
ncbi:hypothetical protein Tco_1420624 [Tanacetum coccineum]